MESDQPTMPLSPRCPRCGCAISPGAPEGLCPRCLLSRALEDEDEDKPDLDSQPERFGGYELLDELGKGGMGVVHKARQVGPIQRVVALKRMRDGDLADAAARRRFLEDAAHLARLRHPHIVPVHDVGEHDGQPYFTMELMSGGTLDGAAARYHEPRRAAALVATLARAVHACHRKGVLHRDLKPTNILFDEHGEPHIADFGIAKSLDKDGLTSTHLLVGSVPYMASEQVTGGPQRNSVAADVWSLGVILYELLAGQRPFDGPTQHEVLRRVVEEEPEPLERLRPGVGRDLATICVTCLQKEPQRRYASAEALADDLDRYLRGEPPLARRPGRVTRAVRWCGRHPGLAAFFGLATLALVTLTLWALVGAREQARARRDEVLAANVFAARAVAGTVLAQLNQYAGWIAKEAGDRRLAAWLTRGDGDALQAFCDDLSARYGGDASPMTWWWYVYDASGHVRTRSPPLPLRDSEPSYSFRDYFRGAMALGADADLPVYVSRGFRSKADNRYKVAILSPIRGEDGAAMGLLGIVIATDRRFGAIELSDERRIAALTVRRDRDDAAEPMPDEHIFLVHDGVAHGEGVVVESEALRRLTARREAAGAAGREQLRLPPAAWVEAQDDYHDRLARPDAEGAQGPWLAGVAPVGNTELAVIVQTRLDEATALDRTPFRVLAAWSVGGALLLLAGVLTAARARAGSKRS